MFDKFKKEQPTLYRAYLAEQEAARLREEKEAKEEEKRVCVNQEPKEKKKASRICYLGTAQICVTSLFHGCGTTYLAEMLAVFFSRYRKGRTCLIETKGLMGEQSLSGMDVVTYPCELSSVYKEHYDFIVRDFGVFDDIKMDEYGDWERADHKCVVCWPDEQSLSRLASFVKKTEHAEQFIFFFNMVPKDMVNGILDIMEDYHVVILPCTSIEKLDKGFLNDLYSIFGKR